VLFSNPPLYSQDMILKYAPIMIVGDDGGFTDYILWNTNNKKTVKLSIYFITFVLGYKSKNMGYSRKK